MLFGRNEPGISHCCKFAHLVDSRPLEASASTLLCFSSTLVMLGIFEYYALFNRHLHDWSVNAGMILVLAFVVGLLGLLAPKAQADVSRRDVFNDFVWMLFIKFGLLGLAIWVHSLAAGWVSPESSGEGWRIYPLAHYLRLPAFPALVLYLLVRDFAQWLKHRAAHTFRPLWALHKVHHANRSLSIFADYRLHILDVAFGTCVTFAVLLVTGFPVEFAFVAISLEECVSMLNHANLRLNYGRWFSRILASPQNHRIHHSRERRHLRGGRDAYNFAPVFPLWDILAGTYYADIEDFPSETGVAEEEELERCGTLRRQWIGFRDFILAWRPRRKRRLISHAILSQRVLGDQKQPELEAERQSA